MTEIKVADLVVIEGCVGVFRVERFVDPSATADGSVPVRLRCFSYVDGRFVVVDAGLVHPCPPLTRAAPPEPGSGGAN